MRSMIKAKRMTESLPFKITLHATSYVALVKEYNSIEENTGVADNVHRQDNLRDKPVPALSNN